MCGLAFELNPSGGCGAVYEVIESEGHFENPTAFKCVWGAARTTGPRCGFFKPQVQFLIGAFTGATVTVFMSLFVLADVRLFFDTLLVCFTLGLGPASWRCAEVPIAFQCGGPRELTMADLLKAVWEHEP